MFLGPPLPLPSDLALRDLWEYAGADPPGELGAWVRCCSSGQRIFRVPHVARCSILVSSDLGFLLTHCHRVVLREGRRPVVLGVEAVIHWRALQVATATPHLPGIERLRALFPGFLSGASAILVPLRAHSPEEVLARCIAEGIQIKGSRVVYSPLALG
ncbi:MAG: hypothetical protein ACREMZ_07505 [Gemmatimonadales bacterium]